MKMTNKSRIAKSQPDIGLVESVQMIGFRPACIFSMLLLAAVNLFYDSIF